jgi:RNA polymerase sigma-70 factor (ECF subfamily)
MSLEDKQYVEGVLAGDPGSFERLVEKYNRMGGAIAYGVLGDYQRAEDVVQEAFFKAFRALGKLRDPARFKVWFAEIVRTDAIDKLRRRRERPLSTVDASVLPQESPFDVTPEDS